MYVYTYIFIPIYQNPLIPVFHDKYSRLSLLSLNFKQPLVVLFLKLCF